MPDINTGQPLRFEQGGFFRLLDTGDSNEPYEVQLRELGTVQLEDGWYSPLRYSNKGEMQVPLEGDEQPSTLRAVFKLTSMEADQLLRLAQQRDALGIMRRFQIELQIPGYKGSTSGHAAGIVGMHFTKPVMVQEGQELDTVTIEMESSEPKWTIDTYTGV